MPSGSSKKSRKTRPGLRSPHTQEKSGTPENNGAATSWILSFPGHTGLLLLGAVLFSLSFPNPATQAGLFPLAYIALLPITPVIRNSRWPGVLLYGVLYGFLTYSIFNYWLFSFHPLAGFLAGGTYAVWFIMVFPLLKLADTVFPQNGWIVQTGIWICFEYVRSLGFFGYTYGILGYSQYLVGPLVRFSSLTGIYGVSLLVVAPSFYLGFLVRDAFGRNGVRLSVLRHTLPARFAESRSGFLMWVVLCTAALGYGAAAKIDYSDARTVTAAFVQQNVDPWEGGVRAYRRSLDILVRQSEAALAERPETEIVIWSETSFVPSISWHTRYRQSRESYELVRDLMDFFSRQSVPYVFGNSDGVLARDSLGREKRLDYNAALLVENGAITGRYHKIRLVPFTEYFPYAETFPWMYRLLVENDTTFWEAGEEYTVMETLGFRFSTPICFEDTFGYITRRFVQEGADVIINLTNDSWSGSVSAAVQHLGMAVFRAAENRRTVVRGTNGGMTAVIDPNGTITDLYPPFTEGYMIAEVPIYNEKSALYTRYGEWLAVVVLGLTVPALIFGILRTVLDKARRKD
jgi:apolipoprotein N-acyltransferase